MINDTRSGQRWRIGRAFDQAGDVPAGISACRRLRIAASVIVLIASIGLVGGESLAMQSPRERLAGEYVRAARVFAGQQPLTVSGLRGARLMVEQALSLSPEGSDIWRLALEIAALGEFDDLKAQAVRELARLDPHDEVIRLMRINLSLEDAATADELLAAYRRWLSEPQIDRIGPAVASRLAMDMALLQRRRGDTAGFAEALAQATALDPSNVDAAALAAGYFQQHVEDAYGQAELFVSLILADPVRVDALTGLAGHLLRHGAYDSARRMYHLARDTRLATGAPVTAEFLADFAIAQWSAGRHDAALGTIRNYQRVINERAQMARWREAPHMSQAELGRITAVADPMVASVRAAIHRSMNNVDEERAEAAFEQAMAAYSHWIERGAANGDDEAAAQLPQLAYHRAWLSVWLGSDVERAREMVAYAQEVQPMNDQATARYDAWLTFRSGDTASARQQFVQLADDDVPSRLGLALVHMERGERRDAARHLLSVARAEPGTLIGVWSSEVLAGMLGQRVPINDMAARLDELIGSIPRVVDRIPSEPNVAMSVRITPAASTYDAYAPLTVTISITNSSSFPMAISADGPIHNQVAMYVDIRSAANPRVQQAGPLFVNIGRTLRLMPRETLDVPVDLRRTRLASVLRDTAVAGTNLEVRLITNHTLTGAGVVVPGALGIERDSGPFRVDGARVNADWISEAMSGIEQVGDPVNLRNVALLLQVISRMNDIQDENLAAVMGTARDQIISAFPNYRPTIQAWLLAITSPSEHIAPMLDVARQSQDPNVQMMYLIQHLRDPADPMIDAGRRSDHPEVRQLAELIASVVEDLRGSSNAGTP